MRQGLIVFVGSLVILGCLWAGKWFLINKNSLTTRMTEIVRPAAFAGSFYPSDPHQLRQTVESFLEEAKKEQKGQGEVKILIVPHAGYVYSGRIAAAGFATLKNAPINRVVLVGVSHTAWFEGAAVFAHGIWETPLGRVKIDEEFAQRLIAASPLIKDEPAPHWQEHSLEVQLPFLQVVLKHFTLVPILLSGENDDGAQVVAEALFDLLDAQTLIVVSTDLSHYPDWATAKKVDHQTIEAILSGDPQTFRQRITALTAQSWPGLETPACGAKAVEVGLWLSKKLKGGRWQLLAYANSGDITGERERVVGYAAIAYFKQNNASLKDLEEKFSPVDSKAAVKLLQIARLTLESWLKEKKIPEIAIDEPQLEQRLGAFVTLKKEGELRGCIGQILPSSDPLWKVVQKMTIEACHDPRFPPVTLKELSQLTIEISILSPLQRVKNPEREIQLGYHGVMVKRGVHSGVFLPQVAQETGWDLNTFLSQLCWQKAGLPPDCWRDKKTELYIFAAQVIEERNEKPQD